jgi:hypothetical protein
MCVCVYRFKQKEEKHYDAEIKVGETISNDMSCGLAPSLYHFLQYIKVYKLKCH